MDRTRCAQILVGLCVAMVIGAGLSSCSAGGSAGVPEDPVPLMDSKDPLCRLLSVTLPSMADDHLTFAGVAEEDPHDRTATGAMLALSLSSADDPPGRFAPIISFLADRGEAAVDAEMGRKSDPPRLTPAIIQNAQALDEEIASGRCDD